MPSAPINANLFVNNAADWVTEPVELSVSSPLLVLTPAPSVIPPAPAFNVTLSWFDDELIAWLTKMALVASSWRLAVAPLVLAIAALTVILPASVPVPIGPVVIWTLVPALRKLVIWPTSIFEAVPFGVQTCVPEIDPNTPLALLELLATPSSKPSEDGAAPSMSFAAKA